MSTVILLRCSRFPGRPKQAVSGGGGNSEKVNGLAKADNLPKRDENDCGPARDKRTRRYTSDISLVSVMG